MREYFLAFIILLGWLYRYKFIHVVVREDGSVSILSDLYSYRNWVIIITTIGTVAYYSITVLERYDNTKCHQSMERARNNITTLQRRVEMV
jgi:hypothetical protein